MCRPSKTIDFSNGQQYNTEKHIEHLSFDKSSDYLFVEDDCVKFHMYSSETTINLVSDQHIDHLINALLYAKTKLKGYN